MSDRGRDPGVECGIGFRERDGGNSGRGVTEGSAEIRKEPVAGLKVVERPSAERDLGLAERRGRILGRGK